MPGRLRSAVLWALLAASAACTGAVNEGDGPSSGGSSAAGTAGATAGGESGTAGSSAAGSGAVAGSSGSSMGGSAPGGAGSGGVVTGGAGAGGEAGGSGAGAGGAGAGGGAGDAGTAGSSGAGGAAGSGGGGGSGPTPSAGCGKASTQMLAQWVEQPTIDVAGTARRWWVYLPTGYDENRAYPVIFLLHGCGNETNNVNMQRVTGSDAILVRGKAVTDCWDTGTNSPDITFFDEMVAGADAGYCTDTSRRFAVGYSSGSWLINTLECVRGGVLRAAGSVAGGATRRNNCSGQIARIFVHDLNDMDNAISGSEVERDRLLGVNLCDANQAPVPEDPAPCARYQGCAPGYPVIWCPTSGQGHARQDTLASDAFWGLFTEL